MNKSYILKDSVFKVGQVISIDGRNVRVRVDKNKNSSHLLYKGKLLKNISVGSYIKIVKGFTKIIGKVEGEFIEEDKLNLNKEYGNSKDKIQRVLSVSMLGFFDDDNKFQRGIKELPLVYDECFLLEYIEFEKVHDFIKKGDDPLNIGYLSQEKGQKINIGVNSLFASHIGIFGNTGSGKSYTLAKLYSELFKQYQDKEGFRENAKFYLFDFNGEYIDKENSVDSVIVDENFKNIYDLSTRTNDRDKFPISEQEINDANFWAVYLTATEKTQTPFLKRAIEGKYYLDKFDNEFSFKNIIKESLNSLIIKKLEKSEILQFLREIQNTLNQNIELISDYENFLQWHSQQRKFYYTGYYDNNQKTIKIFDSQDNFRNDVIDSKIDDIDINVFEISYFEKIRLRIIFQYYHELVKYDLNSEHISPLMKRLKKIEELDRVLCIKDEESDKNFNVISLKNINTEMKKILPLLISKQIYDKQKQKRDKKSYLNIIIDEAHNILSEISNRESETWKDYRLETFEEIIKEGRKFGVFLTIASQRPSDISATIISQLHNYFLHRLINNKDIQAVEKTISYLDKLSFDSLPILPTGSCIFAGLSAQVPVVIDISEIEDGHEPKSETITLLDYWQ